MGAVGLRRQAKDPVARLEGRHLCTHSLNVAGEIEAESVDFGAPKPDDGPREKGIGSPHPAVGPVDGGRMDPDQELRLLWFRLGYVADFDNLRCAIACIRARSHWPLDLSACRLDHRLLNEIQHTLQRSPGFELPRPLVGPNSRCRANPEGKSTSQQRPSDAPRRRTQRM